MEGPTQNRQKSRFRTWAPYRVQCPCLKCQHQLRWILLTFPSVNMGTLSKTVRFSLYPSQWVICPYAHMGIFSQICPYGHMGICEKYGQVGYPLRKHQKCNSETLTSGPQDPPFKSYGQQLFSQGKCLVFYIVTKKKLGYLLLDCQSLSLSFSHCKSHSISASQCQSVSLTVSHHKSL